MCQDPSYKAIVEIATRGEIVWWVEPSLVNWAMHEMVGEVKGPKSALKLISVDSLQRQNSTKVRVCGSTSWGTRMVRTTRDRTMICWVITWIPTSLEAEQIMESIKGAEVHKTSTQDGEKCELSVVLYFAEEQLPSKVYIGYMSYEVRLYILPTIKMLQASKVWTCSSGI